YLDRHYFPKRRSSDLVTYAGKSYEMKDYGTVIEIESAKPVAFYQKDYYKNQPAVTSNEWGEGKAYYIGARLERAFQDDFYGQLIEDLNLKAIVDADAPASVSIQGRRIDESTNLVFVMNFSEESQVVYLSEEVVDIDGDQTISGELTLDPYEVKIVKSQAAQ